MVQDRVGLLKHHAGVGDMVKHPVREGEESVKFHAGVGGIRVQSPVPSIPPTVSCCGGFTQK